jgi:hypothetical protein
MADPRQTPDYTTQGLPSQAALACDAIMAALRVVPIGIRMQSALLAADSLNSLCAVMRQLTNSNTVTAAWRTTGNKATSSPLSNVLYYDTPTTSTTITPRPNGVQYYAVDHVVLRNDHMSVNASIQSAVDTLWFYLSGNQPMFLVLPALEFHWQMVRHLLLATP